MATELLEREEPVELKTVLSTTAGWPPMALRIVRPADTVVEPQFVSDLLPEIAPAGSAGAVRFMRETSFTNNAAALAEGAAKPESALVAAEVVVPLAKVATVLPVTEEVMEDDGMASAYVNGRMRLLVKAALDVQLLQGSGTAPQMAGFLHQTPAIPNLAVGASALDTIAAALSAVRTNGHAVPDAILLNPANWVALVTYKTTGGNIYAGDVVDFGPDRIFGIPVFQTTAIPANTGLVGAFSTMSALATKGGITVEQSDSHNDFFATNLRLLRGEIRAVLCVFRTNAFCSISGLTD